MCVYVCGYRMLGRCLYVCICVWIPNARQVSKMSSSIDELMGNYSVDDLCVCISMEHTRRYTHTYTM